MKHRGQAVPEGLVPRRSPMDGPLSVVELTAEPFEKSGLANEIARKQKIGVLSSDTQDKVNMEKQKIGRNLFLVTI